MKILNISRIGNRIKDLDVIGVNADGCLILCGSGEEMTCFRSGSIVHRLLFFEYDSDNDCLNENIFKDLYVPKILSSTFCYDALTDNGIGFFIEAADGESINIVKCDFNSHNFERLFSISNVYGNSISDSQIQLILLTQRYFAIKIFNKKTCIIYVWDTEKKERYDVLFSENDDMRYAHLDYLSIDDIPYLLVQKRGKSNWKMEFYLHQWEKTTEFNKYKDEKLFLFPLQKLISEGKIVLHENYIIAQVDEKQELLYHSYAKKCIVYSYMHFNKHNKEGFFQEELFFYDTYKKQITDHFTLDGLLLVSKKGCVYEYSNDKNYMIVKNLRGNKTYNLPYQNAGLLNVIDEALILNIKSEIIIFDLKNLREVGRYYSEDKKLNVPSQVRALAIELKHKYFEKENLLVMY